MSNLFLNYNVRGHSIFDGSKIKLSINNLFDDHSIVANSAANDGTTLTLASLRIPQGHAEPAALQPELE